MRRLSAILGVALAVTSPALSQEITPTEPSDWLKSFGSFVRDGFAPPRTAADLVREEEERARKATVEPTPPPPPATVKDLPAPEPVIEAKPTPPTPLPTPEPAPVDKPNPAATVSVSTAVTLPKPRPQAVVPVIQPPPVPVSPSDRIAGTATLDQALKLGGADDLYGRRVRKPAGN